MIKKSLGLAAAAALMLALGACSDDGGGDDTAAYCDEVENAKDTLGGLDPTLDQAAFDEARDQIDQLVESAPSDLDADYQTVEDGFDELQGFFDDAGVSFDDLESLSSGDIPEGADPEKLQELGSELQAWSEDTSIEDSIDAIQTDAEERCDITFDDSEN